MNQLVDQMRTYSAHQQPAIARTTDCCTVCLADRPLKSQNQERVGRESKKEEGLIQKTLVRGSGPDSRFNSLSGIGLSLATVASAGYASAHDCRVGGLGMGVAWLVAIVAPLVPVFGDVIAIVAPVGAAFRVVEFW